jgi:hypothetical protein
MQSHQRGLPNFALERAAIKIDSYFTQTMTCNKDDIVTGIKGKQVTGIKGRQVKGYGGTLTGITHQGTIKWSIATDEGKSREITIPNSFMSPAPQSGFYQLSIGHIRHKTIIPVSEKLMVCHVRRVSCTTMASTKTHTNLHT